MGYLAPLDIIQRMYETNPSAAFRIDTNGANLLHLACLNGASYDCIDYILSQTAAVSSSSRRGDDEDLATRLDADNKCALHLAVEFACKTRRRACQSPFEHCIRRGTTPTHLLDERHTESHMGCAGDA